MSTRTRLTWLLTMAGALPTDDPARRILLGVLAELVRTAKGLERAES